MEVTKPYRPNISLEEVLAFDPAKPETHTVSRLVNAVAEALHDTNYIEAKDIASYLDVNRVKLSAAISLEMGMTLMIRTRLKYFLYILIDMPNQILKVILTPHLGYFAWQ